MALQLDISAAPLDLIVKDAYIRIEQVQHSRFSDGLECIARYYQADPGFPPAMPAFQEMTFRVPYSLTAGDPYTQGYIGAKALDAFAGAKDC
jgi:hypothetical protein